MFGSLFPARELTRDAPLASAPSPERCALFLDFDGVLVDIAPHPDAIEVPEALGPLVRRLTTGLGGAVALVSGRSVADIRAHLPATPDWIAGCHGGERATPRGDRPHPLTDSAAVASVQDAVSTLQRRDARLVAETKPLGAVIHYRAAPEQAAALRKAAERIASYHRAFECHPAKMAFELRPRDVGKDRVLRDWMGKPPFAGRVPMFFGDDLTDEPALDWVQEAGGVAIKVGEGPSVARRRLADPATVLRALEAWLDAH